MSRMLFVPCPRPYTNCTSVAEKYVHMPSSNKKKLLISFPEKKKCTAESGANRKSMLKIFPETGTGRQQTPYISEEIIRKEINVLLAVGRDAVSEVCQIQAVFRLTSGLGEGLIMCL